jgi:hypothetical protein
MVEVAVAALTAVADRDERAGAESDSVPAID